MNIPPVDEILFEGRFCRLRSVDTWEYVERRRATGVVAVLAVTPDGKVLLIEQFRPAVGKRVIEIPAGLVGDAGEDEELATAARRELLEETGYDARTMVFLTDGPAAAGITNEFVTFFRADDLTKVAEGGGVDGEKIVVHEVPLDGVDTWMEGKRRDGCLIDCKVYTALYFQ